MDLSLIIISVAAFISTNIDDLFLLLFFFSSNEYKSWNIIIGQYIGIFFLIFISLAAYIFKFVIPSQYLSILGIIPIFIGFKKLYDLKNHSSEDYYTKKTKNSNTSKVLSVASVTISNGGDNIGVYMPLFATFNQVELGIFMVIFLVLTSLWCLISRYMVNNHIIGDQIKKYGHILLPFVLIFIGIYILFR